MHFFLSTKRTFLFVFIYEKDLSKHTNILGTTNDSSYSFFYVKSKQKKIKQPIIVETPSLNVYQKMIAIQTLAKSNYELAKALTSASTKVTISDCHITTKQNGPALSVKEKDKC